MPPKVALLFCIFFIIGLFLFDEKTKADVSKAVWLPTLWMMMVGTRTVAGWLATTGVVGGGSASSVDQYLVGNPIDKWIFFSFIVVGAFILSRREINWHELFNENKWLVLLVFYCFISILWTDYPFVSFKRWFKWLGNICMVLIVLTDPYPIEALKIMVKRVAFIFVPLSIILIKYFPHIGKGYGFFDGRAYFMGATTGKNALGALCLVTGFFFIWDLSVMWGDNTISSKKKYIIDIVLLIMIIWLLTKAGSATSWLCLGIGVLICLGAKLTIIQRILKRGVIFAIVGCCSTLFVYYLFGQEYLISTAIDMTGHSDTFWGRTVLWGEVISMTPNPIIGAGFESFWLGDRMSKLWNIYWWHPNQAHNGYVEIYINLGIIGLILLFGFFFSTYKNILQTVSFEFDYGRYRIGFFIFILAYNVTEAAMKGLHFMWFMLLLCAINYSYAKNKEL